VAAIRAELEMKVVLDCRPVGPGTECLALTAPNTRRSALYKFETPTEARFERRTQPIAGTDEVNFLPAKSNDDASSIAK
jgi:hypothetical protein